MRRLFVRFLEPGDPEPPATKTFKGAIPDLDWHRIGFWVQHEGFPLWGKQRRYVSINVIRAVPPLFYSR